MNNQLDQNDELSVFVCVPNYFTRAVKIRRSDVCGKLQKFFRQQMDLVYKGQLLDNQSTFASYNINIWEPIVAVRKGQYNREQANWLNVTTESEDFTQAIRNVMCPRYRHSILQRVDIASSKMEMNPKIYRKMIAQYQDSKPRNEDSTRSAPTVISNVGQAIGCDPLPIFWE